MSRGLPRALTGRECRALDFLLDQALKGDGWELRGVRGWRFAEEVACELQRGVEDDLRGLAEDRLLDCVSLDRACRRRGHKLYRVNEAGAHALAVRRGTDPVAVPRIAAATASDDRRRLHLTTSTWTVLDTLVRRRLSGLGPRWNGEPGWMTGAEIHAAGVLWSADVELVWLARLGLVEWGEAEGEGGRRLRVYRATPRGRALRLARTAPLPEAGIVYVEVLCAAGRRAVATTLTGRA